MADVAVAPAEAPATPTTPVRPTKPDEALYQENLAKAEKEHAQVLLQFNAIKQKIDLASPKKNSDNPIAKRKTELLEQKKEIIAKQGDGKNSRGAKQDEIKRLSDQIKSVENKRKELNDTPTFRKLFGDRDSKKPVTETELEKQLQNLRNAYSSGLRLAEEKENISMTGHLEKAKTAIQKQQKEIDDLQAKITEIKETMNSPEAKELSAQFEKVQEELNAINAEQGEARKNLSSLYEEKDKLKARQEEAWQAIRKIKDEFHTQLRTFKKYEREQKQKAWERSKAERERRDKERKLERAQKMLAEASDPAYLDEIRRANSLLQYFDPSFVPEKASLQPSSNLQAQAERKVDGSDMKGVKILSKKDRDEDLFAPAQKKGKKGKKNNAAPSKGVFSVPPSVVEDCSSMGIDPPMSAEEVPGVVEKVKAKLDHWTADQKNQTQKNIEKAKKEIEKIEAEEAKEKDGKKSSSGDATPNGNDAASDEEKPDKVEDVTKEVENASLEDKKEE